MATKTTISLLVISLLVSCAVEDTITLPHQQPRLALSCVGQNGYAWEAMVSRSRDVLEPDQTTSVNNATVSIYEAGALKETLTYRADSHDGALYAGAYFPQPGKSYSISVSAPGYESVIGTYLQPQLIAPSDFKVTVVSSSKDPNGTDFLFDVTLTDPAGENFYEIEVAGNIRVDGQPRGGILFGPRLVDPVYNENNELYNQVVVFADTYFNNSKTTLSFQSNFPDKQYVDQIDDYTAYVRSLSKEYYHYLRTVHLQQKNASDPFAQPVLIENNITNGYGIFGGFTQATKTIAAPK